MNEVLAVLSALMAAVAIALVLRPVIGSAHSRSRQWRPSLWWAGAAGPVLLAVLGWHGRAVVLVGFGAASAAFALWLVRQRRAATQRRERQGQVVALCEGLAAELGAGLPPLTAVVRVVRDLPDLAELGSAVHVGGDVAGTLQHLADVPGWADLRLIAAAWKVAGRSGSGLGEVLGRTATVLTERQQVRRLVESELASTRATSLIMAALPVGTMLVGTSVGGDPLAFLTESTAGLACLGVGLVLTGLGLTWLHRIETAAGGL